MPRSFSFTQPLLVTIGLVYAGLGVMLLFDKQWGSAGLFLLAGAFFLGWSLYLFWKKKMGAVRYSQPIRYGSGGGEDVGGQ